MRATIAVAFTVYGWRLIRRPVESGSDHSTALPGDGGEAPRWLRSVATQLRIRSEREHLKPYASAAASAQGHLAAFVGGIFGGDSGVSRDQSGDGTSKLDLGG